MVGNVVGSNMFNFTIFSIADFIAGNTMVYVYSGHSIAMILFGVLSSLFAIASISLQRKTKKSSLSSGGKNIAFIAFGILICVSYLASMILK